MFPSCKQLSALTALVTLTLYANAQNNDVAVEEVVATRQDSLPGHKRPNIGIGVDTPGAGAKPAVAAEADVTAAPKPDPASIMTITPTWASGTSPTTATTMTVGGASPTVGELRECRLLGPFAILVQLALGGLALLSLVFKRWRERPQRPVKIWFFDVSKQIFGSVLVHVTNVFMSMLTSGRFHIKADPASLGAVVGNTVGTVAARALGRRGHEIEDGAYMPNPCSFYLLNLGIDTTLGIPILILLLHLTTRLVAWTRLGQPPESIQSGYYGHPPKAWWWLKQSLIYFCGLLGMKICVLVLFMLFPWLSRVGDWALGWTEGDEQLQIVFVMMLFPLIMNVLQYYIIDSFIKEKQDDAHHHDGDERPWLARNHSSCTSGSRGGSMSRRYDELSGSGSEDGEELEDRRSEADLEGKPRNGTAGRMSRLRERLGSHEYDPDLDGDSCSLSGTESSAGGETRDKTCNNKTITKELYSPE